MVQFRKKFVTFKDYSEALFDDLFSKEDLDQALYLQAGELRHMYAENKNGTLTFSPLPLESQLAPASSILIRDFDQDGKPDVVISGGFYPNEAHQGRQDASRGVFLKGNGKGSFNYLPNYKSGLYLTGDVRHSLIFEGPQLLISFRNNNSWLWHQLNTPEKK
jgi:enediyne biosynthesis protein E4